MISIENNPRSFYVKKADFLSFKGNSKLLNNRIGDVFQQNPLAKSISYINKINEKLLAKGENVDSISKLDLNKLSGILDGLPTFKYFNYDQIDLLNNILIINTQRGCNNTCGHCFLLAKPISAFKEQTMNWESYTQLMKDFGNLNSRLKFNILGNQFDFAYNYADSDPIEFCSIDRYGKKHNIVEAAELFHKNIKKPIDFSTAGWDADNEFYNQAAKELVEKVKINPELFRGVDVSIHPFQKQMLKASAYFKRSKELENVDADLSSTYYKKYLDARENYVNRMCNVLKTLAPVMKPGYSHIDSQYIFEGNQSPIFTKKQTEDLITEILSKTKEVCEKEGIESYILTNGLEAFKKECMYPPRKIYNTPRIKNNPLETLPNTYSAEIDRGSLNLVVEPFDKTFFNFFENEIAHNVTETLKEDNNSFKKIIVNIDLNNNISQKLQKAEFLSNEAAVENFYERIKNTINAYSKIPQEKLLIRLKYNPNENGIVSEKDIKTFLEKDFSYLNKQEIIYNNSNKESFEPEKPTEAVLKILEHLNPATRRKFISRMKKAIDIDGNLVLLVYNKPYFGTGNFQDVSIKIGDLRLDTNNSTKDKPFLNQLKIDL